MANAGNFWRWLTGIFLDHWGTKATAVILAGVVFIITRDDVTRQFVIPLHVISDPDRILLTDLPNTVTVELHGSWTRINRLGAKDLGEIIVDLKNLQEGQLKIEASSLVMPKGIIFRDLIYDRVDVRFDPILERELPVQSTLQIDIHPDYQFVSTTVDPSHMKIRGPKTAIQEISTLATESQEIKELAADLEIVKSIIRPRENIDFVGYKANERPQVTIHVNVQPRLGDRKIEVPIIHALTGIQAASVPKSQWITIHGPIPDLHVFDDSDTSELITTSIQLDGEDPKHPSAVVVDFMWSEKLAKDTQALLSMEPARKRFPILQPNEPVE